MLAVQDVSVKGSGCSMEWEGGTHYEPRGRDTVVRKQQTDMQLQLQHKVKIQEQVCLLVELTPGWRAPGHVVISAPLSSEMKVAAFSW